jgi:addiction module HigA family antidote
MVKIFNPPHPGFTLRDDVLPALGLGVTQAAEQLGVSRVGLSRVLHGRAAVSPALALRLEAWLGEGNGGAARLWLAQQSAFDEAQARKELKIRPLRIQPAVMPA